MSTRNQSKIFDPLYVKDVLKVYRGKQPVWKTGLVFFVIGLVGVIGDGATTFLMMKSGNFEEANPAANQAMSIIGTGGWIIAASILSFLFLQGLLVKPKAAVWVGLTVFAAAFALVKTGVFVSNTLLWIS